MLRNELGQDEIRDYDKMGRVTAVTQRGGLLTDYYAYDGLGRRIRHWNTLLGAGNVERTDYDPRAGWSRRSRSAATPPRPATPGTPRSSPPASARSAAGPRPRPMPTADR